MASLRDIVREYRDEIMAGIAWVAIWKTGRSWNAQAFRLNLDTEMIEEEDFQDAKDIVAADQNAIFINEYYTAHMGEGKLDEIIAGIRYMYEMEYNCLRDNTAYVGMIEKEQARFETPEKLTLIKEIETDLNATDHSWKWTIEAEDQLDLPFPESVMKMHWGYFGYAGEEQDYFEIIYDHTEKKYSVKDESGTDITKQLSSTFSLRGIMYSVLWYAVSEYQSIENKPIKKYYHAEPAETMKKIVDDGVIKAGWDGCVYLCEKPMDAAKFVAIRGYDDIEVVEISLPENKVTESFDHSITVFGCRAFAYRGDIELGFNVRLTRYRTGGEDNNERKTTSSRDGKT